MEKIQEFRTKDFYTGVICKIAGLKLLRMERADDLYFYFIFADSEFRAEEEIDKYWSGQKKPELEAVISAIRELKSRIYTEKRKYA